jgi:hypothetical protein
MAASEQRPDPDEERPFGTGAKSGDQPGWLVGADDAMTDEFAQETSSERQPPRRPKPPAHAPEPVAAPSTPPPAAWAAAASSIPALPGRAAPADRSAWSPSSANADAEHDDAFGESDDAKTAEQLEDDRWEPTLEKKAAQLRPLNEPWWVVLLDDLRTQRRTQLFALAALVGVCGLAVLAWPRPSSGIPLARIRHNPTEYDGQSVVVRGLVGDVYPVGGGYAFYLLQGRDTIVTFTRSRVPVSREKIVVAGQISTGFLDGAPRQALFESAPQ